MKAKGCTTLAYAVAMVIIFTKNSTSAVNMPTKPYIIVVGASFASEHWPKTTDSYGNETDGSRNALIGGQYRGLCTMLSERLTTIHVSCPAVAGALSTDVSLADFGLGDSHEVIPGYMTQLEQGVHESTWDGKLLAKYLIITLTNDGPDAIYPTMELIARARALGIQNILVQGYSKWGTFDMNKEYRDAVYYHGQEWGNIIRGFFDFVGGVPAKTQYESLATAHKKYLNGYMGVKYIDLYPGGGIGKIDGVHPNPSQTAEAVRRIISAFNG